MPSSKLVRDRIPEIIQETGETPVTHIADDFEYWEKLREKLQEEVSEFLESENPEELADILEVLEAIYTHQKIDPTELMKTKKDKAEKRGGFAKRIILDRI